MQPVEMPSLKLLNSGADGLDFAERIRALYDHFEQDEVLVTTSFGNNSAVLLHLVSQVQPTQKVHFINTGFHFPETLAYKERLTRLLNLNVAEISPSAQINDLSLRRRFWETRPNTCCYLNKVLPLERFKEHHKVWMSGLMGCQTTHRRALQIFEPPSISEKIIRFHPLIDMTEEQSRQFRCLHRLPPHPLEERGYGSVGCQPCTDCAPGRNGRWKDHAKTECGLHTAPCT